MNRIFLLFLAIAVSITTDAQKIPSKKKILTPLRLTNQYFMNKWPDAGKTILQT